jgi:hypothetical protein
MRAFPNIGADAPEAVVARNGEAPDRASDRGPRAEAISSGDCGIPEAEFKAFLTLQPEFALLGHTLFRVSPADRPGWFMVSRWGRTRDLHSLDAVQSFLGQIGGAA